MLQKDDSSDCDDGNTKLLLSADHVLGSVHSNLQVRNLHINLLNSCNSPVKKVLLLLFCFRERVRDRDRTSMGGGAERESQADPRPPSP